MAETTYSYPGLNTPSTKKDIERIADSLQVIAAYALGEAIDKSGTRVEVRDEFTKLWQDTLEGPLKRLGLA